MYSHCIMPLHKITHGSVAYSQRNSFSRGLFLSTVDTQNLVPQDPALDTVFAIPLAMLALPSFDTGSDPRYRSKNALVKTGDSTKPAYTDIKLSQAQPAACVLGKLNLEERHLKAAACRSHEE